jgi:EAL and modified HD-GYP domain-containing signal transduction protein
LPASRKGTLAKRFLGYSAAGKTLVMIDPWGSIPTLYGQRNEVRSQDMTGQVAVASGGADGDQVDQIFLARQPILNSQQKLVAYELLFRGGPVDHAVVTDHLLASSTVVHNAFYGMGIGAVLGSAKGYINADRDFLMSDIVEVLDPKQIILEVLESVVPDAALFERMEHLRSRGFKLALDDFIGFTENATRMLTHVDIVKVDLLRVPSADLAGLVKRLRQLKVTLLAEKVEATKEFDQAVLLGFDLFQGYHFARPQLLAGGQRRNPAKVQLLRLLGLILGDADVGLLEAEFKHQPVLTYNLLRMVNSAAMGLRTRINSLRHALILIGRRPLQSWMQLTLYTAGGGDPASTPLLQMAAVRGRLMEAVLREIGIHSQRELDAAFLTGILSLVDALLEMPQDEILDKLFLSEEVKAALLTHEGRLGELLELAVKLEGDSSDDLQAALRRFPDVSAERLLELQFEAFAWASSVETA